MTIIYIAFIYDKWFNTINYRFAVVVVVTTAVIFTWFEKFSLKSIFTAKSFTSSQFKKVASSKLKKKIVLLPRAMAWNLSGLTFILLLVNYLNLAVSLLTLNKSCKFWLTFWQDVIICIITYTFIYKVSQCGSRENPYGLE